eukprot:7381815-Prymnesium_polylepis.1
MVFAVAYEGMATPSAAVQFVQAPPRLRAADRARACATRTSAPAQPRPRRDPRPPGPIPGP